MNMQKITQNVIKSDTYHRCPARNLDYAKLDDEEISVDRNQEGGKGGEKDKSRLKIIIMMIQFSNNEVKKRRLTCEVPTSLHIIS